MFQRFRSNAASAKQLAIIRRSRDQRRHGQCTLTLRCVGAMVQNGGRGKRKKSDETTVVEIEWPDDEQAPPSRNRIALWDFKTVASTKLPAKFEEPSAEKEQKRAQLMLLFRSEYSRFCKEVMGLETVPADSVDRWLLEQLAQPGGGPDPLLPRPRIAESSRVLLRELLAEVPMRCHSRVTGRLAYEQLTRYLKSARAWLGRLQVRYG
eukprot:s354_g10.t1